MRLSLKKILWSALSVTVIGFTAFQIFSINQAARKTLDLERARLITQNRVPFEKKILAPHFSPNLEIWQSAENTRDFVRFQDSYFAATDGGLVRYSDEGGVLKHFTVLDGLPESDLTCLTVFGGKLFIGTRTKNLVTFDGVRFENYIWKDRNAQTVTSFLEANGKLLIGTFAGGLLEFDNQSFTEIKSDKTKILAVNSLFGDGARLFVGTFDNGLWIYENDIWSRYTNLDGLPSNRVVGIAIKDKKLFVATDFGLAVLEDKSFRTISHLPSLSSLISQADKLILMRDNGRISVYDKSTTELSAPESMQNARLVAVDEKLWLLSDKGILAITGERLKPFNQSQNRLLTNNFISAIALDHKENLWAGTFRNGLDVVSDDGNKRGHVETEEIREINYLESDGEIMQAATSSGLIQIKSDFTVENLTKKDGLPSDSITHFSGEFVATAKGLAVREKEKFHVFSTVQGLPSNSVYALLRIGKKLYAGTLGGLAEIENNRITRTFKDTNSNLTTNWVTSLCSANERIFIGTYGGGVFELLPSGEIHSFQSETGKFTVNPNAIFTDGDRLYIGTLAGVKILDLKTGEWKTFKSFLPAETVLAVTGSAENIYFGTTNGIAKVRKDYFAKGE
jgi:ligand-binding sensor domain-containing protein